MPTSRLPNGRQRDRSKERRQRLAGLLKAGLRVSDSLRRCLIESVAGLNPIAKFAWHSRWLLIGMAVSLISSILYVNLVGSLVGRHFVNEQAYVWYWQLALLVWAVSFFVALWAGLGAIVGAFVRQERRVLLSRILASYFSLILMFAGLYYSMSLGGDLEDARTKYVHYRHESQLLRAGLRQQPRVIADRRVFQGIKQRLWSGVDWPVYQPEFRRGDLPEDFEVSPQEMLSLARRDLRGVVRFVPNARRDVFLDCLHFSIVTMGTLGYGDIVPRSRAAKLAADLQVLSGVLLLGVALGMALGGRGKEKKKIRSVFLKWAIAGLAIMIFVGYIKTRPDNSDHEGYRWLNATDSSFSEFDDGLQERARIDAEISLRLAGDYRSSWNYGNAIFEANTVLGLLSIREGRVLEAGTYLLEAGASPGSPQLNSFGPRMELANMLLRQGKRDVVLRYLDLCGLFWEGGRAELKMWSDEVAAGKTPDLCNWSVEGKYCLSLGRVQNGSGM